MDFLKEPSLTERLDVLAGASPRPDRRPPPDLWSAAARGVLWAALFLLAFAFMGSDVKFVYIDF